MESKTKKIRVCFISPKAYPIFNPDIRSVFGGAEVDLYLLATELAKDPRFEVLFIVGDYGQPKIEQREGVTLIKSLDVRKNMILYGWKVWQALQRADADIYMIETASLGVPLVSFFCRRHKKRFVYRTAHVQECNGDYAREKPLSGFFFARSLRNADIVFCQNRSDKAALKTGAGIEAVVASNTYRDDLTGDFEKKTILWVGRSAAFKHPERFLELAKSFSRENFVMICPQATNDSNYESLRQKAEQINHLRFYERVDFFEIDRFFAEAKVFVNTSDSEGYPNTFIQACKAQTAILSYVVNPDGFLDYYRCGICCHGNIAAMIDGLRNLLENNRYVELGRNGRAYVEKNHDIRALIEQYKTVFQSIGPQPKGNRPE
jgi:glycosyltransferase involved in cell wall biosynthesis